MVTRISLSLDPVDVELLDRLAALRGLNRSEQMREILGSARPMMEQTVHVLEQALKQRDRLLDTFTQAEVLGLQELLPEIEKIQNAVLGSMSRLEGAMAVETYDYIELSGEPFDDDPRGSNHGGHTPTPDEEDTTS